MTGEWTLEQLRRRSLGRQFPGVRARGLGAITEVLERVGPLQTQTARSAFLGLAARLPGVTKASITAAYEQHAVGRGSTLRGTVHTCTPGQHPVTEAVTRLGQRAFWQRTLWPERTTPEQLWAAHERFAEQEWRTPDELVQHLLDWLAQHEGPAHRPRLAGQAGRSLGFSHGGLLRRPLRGGWEGQGAPGYRAARALLADGPTREALLADPAMAVRQLVLLHLRCYGPATRRDIAWWSGLGLRPVDAALAAVAHTGEAGARPGPGGLEHWDLTGGAPPGRDDVGTRLLPEFDAVLVGYHPQARERFVAAEHLAVLWTQANGLILPPVLHAGRVVGYWRTSGSGERRDLAVSVFRGMPRPGETDLAPAVTAIETAMGWQVADLSVATHR